MNAIGVTRRAARRWARAAFCAVDHRTTRSNASRYGRALRGRGREQWLGRGGGAPPSTRSTSAASRTRTATASATCQGIRSRLPYLQELGVDALWLTPFYPSPQADHGYDVADYVDVDPLFGTLADFDELVADAHERGIKVTIDIVPNHTSDQHEWFRNAIADPTHPDRKRYMFRPGRNGGPPNGWTSAFGGPAWTLDEQTGEYYLHFFAPEQPDLDWHHEAVQDSFDEILRFWLDRGVDGFRIDVAHALFKAQDLPEMVEPTPRPPFGDWLSALMQPELHPLYRRWRRIADEYPGDRMFVSEITIENQDTIASYVAPDQLHLSFDFTLLHEQWDAERMRATIDRVADDARRRRRARDLGLREPRRDPAADPLRRRRARAAARPRRGAPALRPAGRGVHLPGPGARARGGRCPGRGAPGSDLPPHRRRTERAATAAACRSRGRRSRRRSASPTASRGCRCPRTGGCSASRQQERDPDSTLSLFRSALRLRPRARPVRLAREPAGDDDLRPRRPDVPRQRRRGRARAAGR